MRISCQILFLLALSTQLLIANSSSGQNAGQVRIDIEGRNISLKQLFKVIEKKSGLRFIYNDKLVEGHGIFSFEEKGQTVQWILSEALKNTELGYLEKNRKIIIVPKEESLAAIRRAESTVTGSVKDENGEPLLGVSVKVKGSAVSVTTDLQGNFGIVVPDNNAVLVFSYIGFETLELPVGGRSSINVVLKEGINSLNEVVVIGYGTQRRADVTSAVATVKAENFVKGPVVDAGQLLQGKVAGLTVNVPSGNPVSGSQILLRGRTTINGANTDPLVIIDGIPGSLNMIAPEDIESIDVLKDGSAAAIYGVRGSNGVIIITTKRAKGNVTNNVDYSSYVSTQTVARKLDMLTADDYRAQIAAGQRSSSWDLGANTDWLKETTQTPLSHVHNLTFRGGNATTNYLASANYRSLEGIFLESANKTFQGRIDVNHSMFNDKLKFNVGVLSTTNRHNLNAVNNSFNGWIYRQASIRNPTEPVRNANGTFHEVPGNFDYENPVALMKESDGNSKNVTSRLSSAVTFSPMPDLRFTGTVAFTRTNNDNYYYETKGHISNIKSGVNGYANLYNAVRTDRLASLKVDYTKALLQHRFNFTGGYEYQDSDFANLSVSNQDFPTDMFGYDAIELGQGLPNKRASMSSDRTVNNLIGFFGRLNYSFADRYLLMLSIRHEGASQLWGSNDPWGTFWSASTGWRITNENFMKNQKVFDDLKLRVGYGITGNPPSAQFLSQGLLEYGDFVYSNGKWIQSIRPATNPNPFIRWEEKHESNIGLDFSMLKGVLAGSFDFYNRDTKDLLYDFQVPSPPNLYDRTTANVGTMRSRGVEALLNVRAFNKKDFQWNTSFNFSTNNVKIKSLSNELYQASTDYFTWGFAGIPIQTFTHIVYVGKGIGDFYGYKVIDVDADGKWIYEGKDGQPVKYSDLPHSFEDKKVIGNGLPKYYAGWNNSFAYKNFDLNVSMRGAFGFQIINSQRMYFENPATQNYNVLKSAYDPVFGKAQLNVPALEFNSYYVENGDYWKIDNITLGYNFKKFRTGYIKGARIYASSLNSFVITNYKGIDPEVNAIGLDPGLDNRDKYPTTRTFTLGLNFNF